MSPLLSNFSDRNGAPQRGQERVCAETLDSDLSAFRFLSQELGALARREAENAKIIFTMKLQLADVLAGEFGWKYGASARAEIENIIPGLADSLPRKGSPVTSLSHGAVLESYFLKAAGLKSRIDLERAPAGSLSAKDSMFCIHDEARTKVFLLGVRDAVAALASKNERIHVVEAGCGAIPLLSIYAALCSPKVHVSAIELNPASLELAQAVIEGFGLEGRIKLFRADARKFHPAKRADILISETMAAALTGEPMVDIFQRQIKNLNPGAHILPTAVHIKAGTVAIEQYKNPKATIVVGTNSVPQVDPAWRESLRYLPGEKLPQVRFTLATDNLQAGLHAVVVGSEVQVGTRTLDLYDSLLSSPSLVYEVAQGKPLRVTVPQLGKSPTVHIYYPPGNLARGHTSTSL